MSSVPVLGKNEGVSCNYTYSQISYFMVIVLNFDRYKYYL
jgi:hypothetical protein